MAATLILLAAVVGLVAWYLRDYIRFMIQRAQGRLPPGPPAYPFIGSPGIDEDAPWETMNKWGDRYGPLFTFFLGPQLQLVINDAELARTVLKDVRFEGRPVTTLSRIFKNNGLAFSEGAKWKDTRRFEIVALKDFGRATGENLLERYVQEAASQLTGEFHATSGAPFQTWDSMQRCVANCIASALCGHMLKSDDPRFARITENVTVILGDATVPTNLLNVFPWLGYFPPYNQQQRLLFERLDETVGFIRDVVEEHKKTFDEDNVRDFIDAYLKEQRKPGSNPDSFTDDQLVYMGVEMYAAGLDGTLASLQWWALLIASHPEIQKRSQEEIEANIGTDKLASWSDRNVLPYNEAILNEVLRIATVDPTGLPHRCTEDTPLNGYVIPKDTALIVNYYGIHLSPENFPDPWVFRPERFIDSNGKFVANANNLPFATGRRMCSGDTFARMIVFITMISIMQRFTLKRTESRPWTDIKRINAVGVRPDKFSVTAVSK